MSSPNAWEKPPACMSVLHGFQMGDIVQEAKDQWYDAQPALDCEQQLKCGFAFCRGDSPWPALGLGEPGHAPISWPCALAPSVFPKRNPVLSLQVTRS